MEIIYNPETFNKHADSIAMFVEFYERNFPDQLEREDFAIIKNRILKNTYNDDPKIFLIIIDKSGLVVEYYHSCGSLLLTYIVVDDSLRNKGLAKKLILEGLLEVIGIIENEVGAKPNAIFFETNNPTKTDIDSFDPRTRLAIFKKMGAKFIDIPYTQPSLGENKGRVHNLFLCCFPLHGLGNEFIKTDVIINFLKSFYKALGIEKPENDGDFQRMIKKLDQEDLEGYYLLREIPRIENHKIEFPNASIAVHIPTKEGSEFSYNCSFFGSFETDLLSYKNQKKTPFKTRALRPYDPLQIEIHFPEEIKYLSEGRYETILSKRKQIPVKVYPSLTRFRDKNGCVFTITFQPGDDSFFSELDIIKLSALFGSRQEKTNIKSDILFEEKGVKLSFEKFVNKVFNDFSFDKISFDIITGSIQIDPKDAKYSGNKVIDWQQLLLLLHSIEKDDFHGLTTLQNHYTEEPDIEYISNSLCGITLGIFDYERMGLDEFLDTVSPIISSQNSFIVMSRGTIINVSYEDELFISTQNTIGISPYIIIPNIVLTYNELILTKGISKLRNAIIPGKLNHQNIENSLKEVQASVSNVLHDVFNYETEKTLLEFGTQERNLVQLTKELEDVRNEAKNTLAQLYNMRKDKFDMFVTIILIIITILQIETVLKTFIQIYIVKDIKATEADKIELFLLPSIIIISIAVYFIIKKITSKKSLSDSAE